MKKSLVIVGAVLSLVACNKEGAAPVNGLKTAYVDTSKLFEKSDELKAWEDKAKVKEDELKRDMQKDDQQLRLEAAALEGEAKAKGMQWAQMKAQQLQQRQQELTGKYQQLQEKFSKEEGTKHDSILSRMQKFIKAYGKKKGYDYIFGTVDASNVIYAKDSYDITNEIIKEVNDTYKSSGKAEETTTAEKK